MVAQKLSQLSTIADFVTGVNFLIVFLKIYYYELHQPKKCYTPNESPQVGDYYEPPSFCLNHMPYVKVVKSLKIKVKKFYLTKISKFQIF